MMLKRVSQCLICLVSCILVVYSQPSVTVKQGALFGETVDFVDNEVTNIQTQVDVFKGIPFAEPPIRFTPPVTKQSWEGEWNATFFRPACVQPGDFYKFWFKPEMSEDCLYLNVYAPHPKPTKAPVMVLLHGGGYVLGSAIEDGYSGVPLAAIGDVIIVTTNYRLGVFGFLSTGDSASPGNYGLLDQTEALRWVQQNIEAFGGDKDKVTIFGESAGARAAHIHLFSKLSAPYFHRAIMQSGTARVRSDPEGERNDALYLGSQFNCDTTNTQALVECLRAVDAMELMSRNTYPTIPNVDGHFLQDTPESFLLRGDFKQCPIIIGFNHDEGTLNTAGYFEGSNVAKDPPYANKDKFDEMVSGTVQWSGEFFNELMENAIKQEYVDWSQAENVSADYLDTFVELRTDQTYSCDAIETAKKHAMMELPVYVYFLTQIPFNSVFEYYGRGPGWFKAGHVEDIQYVFGTGFITELLEAQPASLEDKELSVDVITFWTNFASSGNPSRRNTSDPLGSGKWAWPKFEMSGPEYKEIATGLPLGRTLRADECNLWTNFLEELRIYMVSMDDAEREWREHFEYWQQDLEEWRLVFQTYKDDDTCQT